MKIVKFLLQILHDVANVLIISRFLCVCLRCKTAKHQTNCHVNRKYTSESAHFLIILLLSRKPQTDCLTIVLKHFLCQKVVRGKYFSELLTFYARIRQNILKNRIQKKEF